jgi:ABC-type transport system involved in cytochrome bd biosynthesis fused ATPase/permease subunit
MSEIRAIGEMRTDLDQEATDLKAERWAEAVFTIGDEELVLEISIEENVMVALMVGDDAQWKGTLEGLKKFLRGEIPAR